MASEGVGVWLFDLKTHRIEWSDGVYAVLGVAEFDGTRDAWLSIIHPDDRPDTQALFAHSMVEPPPFSAEFRIVRQDGVVAWVSNTANIVYSDEGIPTAVVGTVRDITARKRSEWALTAYNRVLELIASGAGLSETLSAVVAMVEEQLPGSLCSVLTVERGAGRLRVGAAPSLPASYNAVVDGLPIGPMVGSCGAAAFYGQTVVATDIGTDPLWTEYRAEALSHGLRSCVSVPILASGDVPGLDRGAVIGTFACYERESGAPHPRALAILSTAEQLARRAIRGGNPLDAPLQPAFVEGTPIAEAAHLAGVAIERAHAAEAVRESEERFRRVLDSSPSAVHLEDVDRRYLFVNRTMADWFGVPLGGWAGRTAQEVLGRPLVPGAAATVGEARRHGELDIELPDGRRRRVLSDRFPLRARDGSTYATCEVLTDITELEDMRGELLRLWSHAPEPLCVVGFDGVLRRVNPAWTRCLGWSETELVGRHWAELVHADDLGATVGALGRLRVGEAVHRLECRFARSDGSYRWFSWDMIPRAEEGIFYGFVRDVTEERRLAEQLQHAQKMEAVGRLASGVAHDFNNLLTIINGYSAMLLEELAPDHSDREPLTEVHAAGRRATELTAQLLAFARKAMVEPRLVDVNAVVAASSRMLRRLIGEDIELVTELQAVPVVRIDPGQLDQVMMNLAVNARDAMPTGGVLSIATAAVGPPTSTSDGSEVSAAAPGAGAGGGELGDRWVRITLRDSGSGMTPEVRARIFEPFFTTKGLAKGTGLGLSTVYGIVRQAGGDITVESTVGRGSAFHIVLPAHRGEANGLPAGPPAAAPRGTETVLVAEDEDAVRQLTRRVLERLGYRVLTASGGAAALEVEAQHDGPIDLLLTDVVMPDFGGAVLAEQLRARRPNVRVLFMSGYMDDSMLRHGVDAPAVGLIQKPFTHTALAQRVRETLDSTG